MGSVISCSELIINQECCTSAFSPLLLQQPLLHPAVLSTVKPLLQLLLPHGKYPSKSQEAISAEDPSSPQDSLCLLATANKPSELMLLWEPSTTHNQSSQSEVHSPAIQNTQLSRLLTTITQSLLLLPTLT